MRLIILLFLVSCASLEDDTFKEKEEPSVKVRCPCDRH